MEKVNLYLVHNNNRKSRGGNFYNVYVSSRDDLDYNPEMDIEEYEAYCLANDESFKKAGGIIVGKNEYIDDTKIYSDSSLELEHAETLSDIDSELLGLYYQKDLLFKEYLKQRIEIDQKIKAVYEERKELETGYQKKLVK